MIENIEKPKTVTILIIIELESCFTTIICEQELNQRSVDTSEYRRLIKLYKVIIK